MQFISKILGVMGTSYIMGLRVPNIIIPVFLTGLIVPVTMFAFDTTALINTILELKTIQAQEYASTSSVVGTINSYAPVLNNVTWAKKFTIIADNIKALSTSVDINQVKQMLEPVSLHCDMARIDGLTTRTQALELISEVIEKLQKQADVYFSEHEARETAAKAAERLFVDQKAAKVGAVTKEVIVKAAAVQSNLSFYGTIGIALGAVAFYTVLFTNIFLPVAA